MFTYKSRQGAYSALFCFPGLCGNGGSVSLLKLYIFLQSVCIRLRPYTDAAQDLTERVQYLHTAQAS